MSKMNCGIYQVRNVKTGATYVGSSSNIYGRWSVHRSLLRSGKHHSPRMQNSWNLHGERSFEFSKLLICDERDLLNFEQRAIDALRPEYNASPIAGRITGLKRSAETRAKMSLRQLGNSKGRGNKGKHHSEDTKEKLRAASMGNKNCLGRIWRAEERAKIGAANRLRKRNPESAAKISAALTGIVRSDLTRQRMREAQKRRREAERLNVNVA